MLVCYHATRIKSFPLCCNKQLCLFSLHRLAFTILSFCTGWFSSTILASLHLSFYPEYGFIFPVRSIPRASMHPCQLHEIFFSLQTVSVIFLLSELWCAYCPCIRNHWNGVCISLLALLFPSPFPITTYSINCAIHLVNMPHILQGISEQ